MKYWAEPKARAMGLIPIVTPTFGDAGYDIRSYQDFFIIAGHFVRVSTGIHLAIPIGFVGLIKDRSSFANAKIITHGGVIDSRFRGELEIILENTGSVDFFISTGDRIAQMIITSAYTRDAEEVDTLEELGITDRMEGFGITGRK